MLFKEIITVCCKNHVERVQNNDMGKTRIL